MKIRCSFNVNGFVKENMDENFFHFFFRRQKCSNRNKLRWESVSPKEPDDFIFYVEHHQLNAVNLIRKWK